MAPLILHNVPDDELYVGEDGKKRPYAMVFPQHEGHAAALRGRRAVVAETGSFGRSARRSRSKTATPARKEDPTLVAAHAVFQDWFAVQNKAKEGEDGAATAAQKQRKASGELPMATGDDAPPAAATARFEQQRVPVEVILRGYRSSRQQYAAIDHYEQVAGMICEDYARDPPAENRRYRSELRDAARGSSSLAPGGGGISGRRRALTPEERARVNRADGGEHWVKVTFESAAAADRAMSVSPQRILGHLVYCEPYHNMPPAAGDVAVPDIVGNAGELLAGAAATSGSRFPSRGLSRTERANGGGASSSVPKSHSSLGLPGDFPPSIASMPSSRTIDTGTLDSFTESMTVSSATATGREAPAGQLVSSTSPRTGDDGLYCRTIPTVPRAKLRPAEQALLPQQSLAQRVINIVPFIKWFSGSMIGNEVPRTELGEFDWDKASLYWKVIWWLDATFRLFGGEIVSADKDD
ncbi:hypothetical protein RB595_010077 [Gaeumannomyces hyphopodioides]